MSAERPVYEARAERDGDLWFLKVEGVPGAYTQAKRLDLAEPLVRDVIALVLEVPPDSFDVQVVPVVSDPEVAQLVKEALEQRAAADVAAARASTSMRLAAKALAGDGLPIRDVGRLLRISHQRVAQLLATSGHTKWSEIKRKKGAA